MTLGEKLKQARKERHLTQRDVVGDQITRNMLSKIENGSAMPSMKTLEYLAGKLGLPVGYFVSDSSVAVVPAGLETAREAFREGDYEAAAAELDAIVGQDLRDEQQMLLARCHLALAQAAAASNDLTCALSHARIALEANAQTIYSSPLLGAAAALLVARFDPDSYEEAMAQYRSLEPQLSLEHSYRLTQTQHYLHENQPEAAAAELAQLNCEAPDAELLRLQGELALCSEDYGAAAAQLRRAEQLAGLSGGSEETMGPLYAMLEQCYREMGDYKEAYQYAAKQIKR